MSLRHPLTSLLWLVLGLGCFGDCYSGGGSGGCNDEPLPESRCNRPYTGASLDGEWALHATGRRENCRDRRLEGALEIDTSVPLEIEARAQETFGDAGGPEVDNESDAFVQRIERAGFELGGDALPRKVTFSGEVRGSCVSFTLVEPLPNGDELRYQLNGALDDVGEVERCSSSGSFTARIR